MGGVWEHSAVDNARRVEALNQAAIYVELALGDFRRERGRYPNSLAELVPKHLGKVPADPFAHAPLGYRRLPNGGYLLYSVGIDGIDQDGTRGDDRAFVGQPRMP